MKRKKIIINILIVIFVVTGLGILFLPFLRFFIAEQRESYVVQEYNDVYAKMKDQEKQSVWEDAVKYNNGLQIGALTDPFTQSVNGNGDEYLNALNIGSDGMMGYIEIPKISLRLPIYHGTTAEILERGAGHLEGAHLPIGGAGTHAVLTGHTGLESSVLFTNLSELKEEDEFYIRILDQILAYRIDQIMVVTPSETETLQPTAEEDFVTLVTCTPYGINSHRLLVRGSRVDYTPEEAKEAIAKTEKTLDWMTLIFRGAVILCILLVLLMGFRVWKKRKKKRRR